MHFRKNCFVWLMVLVILATGVLTACAPSSAPGETTGGTTGETTGDAPQVQDTAVYVQIEYTRTDKNGNVSSTKYVYNADGTLYSYATQTVISGVASDTGITYTWEDGQITGAMLKLDTAEIPVRYDYRKDNPSVLEKITVSDSNSPCWLEATCDTKGQVTKVEVGDSGDSIPFWTYTYTYAEDSVTIHYYSGSEPIRIARQNKEGKVLEETHFFDGKVTDRYVYTYDAEGYMTQEVHYDGKDKQVGRHTYVNNAQGDPVESDLYDANDNRIAHYTLCYNAQGEMTEQNIYDGNGNFIKAQKTDYTYDNKKLTAVRDQVIQGNKTQAVDFTVTHQGNTATVVAQKLEGDYFAKEYTPGVIAARYTVDDSGELIAKELFYADGAPAISYKYEKLPAPPVNKWLKDDPKMLIEMLTWFA